jgi:hypothetical protein
MCRKGFGGQVAHPTTILPPGKRFHYAGSFFLYSTSWASLIDSFGLKKDDELLRASSGH